MVAGGVRGPGGACMVAAGGYMVGRGGVLGCSWGVCMVAVWGGMRGCSQGGVRGIRRDTDIRSMSGRYASYWNAFLFTNLFVIFAVIFKFAKGLY